ncbi:MAG: hypothetical protein RR847_00235 [Bacilli bacterium]
MTTDGKDKRYVIMTCAVLLALILGSLFVSFNFIDLGYVIILIFYIIRYFYIKR